MSPSSAVPTTASGRRGGGAGASWWLLVVAAGVVSAMTAPGQTAGLSVFTDPLISELDVSRTGISLSYLVGTLAGAAAQPFVGRALDRWGARTVTLCIGAGFAGVLLALSAVGEILGLTLGFVGVRMLGQGALSLAATTAVARGVHTRRGLALGVTSAIGSAGISLAPVGLERLISAVGVHSAWRWEALAVLVIVVPLALLFPRRAKTSEAPTTAQIRLQDASWTLPEATRSGMFWVLAASLATSGMLSTGLAFHQIAILGEQGLTPLEAAANFLPQTVTGILATLLTGALVDRVSPKLIIAFSMLTLAGALVMLPIVAPGWTAIVYGLVLGAAGGGLRGMEAATYVRYYGTANIGAIRGVATSINLASTALGPIALAAGADLTGGFAGPSAVLAVIPVGVVIGAVIVRPPRRGHVTER